MGNLNPRSLYLDLLEDLRVYLEPEVISALSEGGNVDFWPGIDIKEVASISLAKSLTKKYVASIKDTAESIALEKFIQVNNQCEQYRFPSLSIYRSGLRDCYDMELLGEFKTHLRDFVEKLPTLTFSSILRRGRMGPGASIGSYGQDFYTKLFAGPISTTKEALYLAYLKDIDCDPRWKTASELRTNHFGGPSIVRGNRLSFVPKTEDVSRTICTEPSLNMFYQLGLGAILEDGLKRLYGIDLSVQQEKNRRLARRGSRSGDYGTIDLSSASDSISLGLLKGCLPKELLDWLVLFRSPSSLLPNGKEVELHMISTMGNGYTFPLQTLLFTCAVLAVYRCRGVRYHPPYGDLTGNFAVNGDDIIVVRECYDDVCYLLNMLGFSVNAKKSFNEGLFRESCGLDSFNGVDVRGVYLKTLDTPQDIYSSVNRLIRWQSRHEVYLPRLTTRLIQMVKYLPVPPDEDDGAGFHVPRSLVADLRRDPNGAILFKGWKARQVKLRVEDDEIVGPRKQRKRVFNPEGLVLSFLAGYLRDHGLNLRLEVVNYDLKRGKSPNWGFLPANRGIDPEGWTHWERVSRFYFS